MLVFVQVVGSGIHNSCKTFAEEHIIDDLRDLSTHISSAVSVILKNCRIGRKTQYGDLNDLPTGPE